MLNALFGSPITRAVLAMCCYVLVSFVLFLSTEASGKWDSKAEEGAAVWRKYNCVACHSIYGLGGHVGPDLTNTISRRNPAYVDLLIRQGKGEMPNLGVTETEAKALIRYLSELDDLGEYPLRGELLPAFGRNR